jgi:bifunctional non-homologous end joining protein LigD
MARWCAFSPGTWTDRFPLIVAGMAGLKVGSCLIDGEAVCCEDDGVPSFELLRDRRHDGAAFLYAFDLLELDSDDLRREPLVTRKATLASLLSKASPGILLNEHFEHDGPTVFAHACKLGLEGIVSKRKDSPYRSGRTPDWLRCKNPASPAAKRDSEGFDWGR